MTYNFTYIDDIKDIEPEEGEFQATLEQKVETVEELLVDLKRALLFPSYFGYNWNALDECMRDLEWLPNHRVSLIHLGNFDLFDEEIKTYLEVLDSAVRFWEKEEEHKLSIYFLSNHKDYISRIMNK